MILSVANYLIRSCISLALLFLFYRLFLSRDRFLKFNRFYLVFSLSFSQLIPLISFPAFHITPESNSTLNILNLMDSYFQIQYFNSPASSLIAWNTVIILFYSTFSLIFLLRFLHNLFGLSLRKFKCQTVRIENRNLVLVKNLGLPYSFFSNVFVDESEFRSGTIPRELLLHEFAHIDQRHSWDIIFIESLRVIFWFNPLFILYKNAIILNHEYLADHEVTKAQNSNSSYLNMLIKIVFRKNNSYLASSFNHSFTKKRLLMITKENNSKTAILKKIITIPLFIFVGLLVMDAQVQKTVPHKSPPPPPPPFGYDTWWSSVLAQHKITPIPSKIWYSHNVFETGEQFLKEDNKVNLKDAFILARSVDNLYRIIEAKSVIHDLDNNYYACKGAKVETYKVAENKIATLIKTEYYKDFGFKLSNDLIAPPPPPPPVKPEDQMN